MYNSYVEGMDTILSKVTNWFKGYRVVPQEKRIQSIDMEYTIDEGLDARTLEWQRERWKVDPDPIVATVVKRMTERSREGIKKYGCTMERTDITTSQWIDHTIEELLDAAMYLERLKQDVLVPQSTKESLWESLK